MKYDLIFFDLDGTLVDSLPDIHYNINKMLKIFGRESVTREKVRSNIGFGAKNLVKGIVGELDDSNFAEMYRVYSEFYNRSSHDLTIIYQGVKETLSIIKTTKILITNKSKDPTVNVLDKFGIGDLFDEIITPEMFGVHKPDPAPVLRMLEQYSVNQDRALLIGDSKYDLMTCKNAGIDCCLVSYGFGGNDDMSGAEYYIDRFSEVSDIIK